MTAMTAIKPRKILYYACLALSTASLIAGLGTSGRWLLAVLALIPAGLLLFVRKSTDAWIPALYLLLSVCLAGAGLLMKAAPALMILSATGALAAWDLRLFGHPLEDSSDEHTGLLEKEHLRSLAMALGLGLLVAELGRLPRLQIPFIAIVGMVILILLCVNWVYLRIENRE